MPLQHLYASELSALCTKVQPFPVASPEVTTINHALRSELGLEGLLPNEDAILQALFSPEGTLQENSVAQKYGGHQFGHWNPQLGDGRGLLLGEISTPQGELIDLHLKGAGPTPYSRHADGRAVLRSTIREYLASEALHSLNIPTSRALALINSNEPVMRESLERGAMLIRTCPSHIRFGHFEYFYHANEHEKLDELFSFCFAHHFTQEAKSENPYLALLTSICVSTAKMIAKWQAYGFNHGVMNTDNMSIHGITFDFGPYAFLDDFVPNYICNSSDHGGRYAFNQQPSIGLWNLNALAHAFSNKLNVDEIKQALATFEPQFLSAYKTEMFARFGFTEAVLTAPENTTDEDSLISLSNRFIQLLSEESADYHGSFRRLSESFNDIKKGNIDGFCDTFLQLNEMRDWCKQYTALIESCQANITQQDLLGRNPKFVLRNHHMQDAIEKAENGDFSTFNDLLKVVTRPFDEHADLHALSLAPEDSDKGIALSCSS